MRPYFLILIVFFFFTNLSAQEVDCTNYSQWNLDTIYQRSEGGDQIYVVHNDFFYR